MKILTVAFMLLFKNPIITALHLDIKIRRLQMKGEWIYTFHCYALFYLNITCSCTWFTPLLNFHIQWSFTGKKLDWLRTRMFKTHFHHPNTLVNFHVKILWLSSFTEISWSVSITQLSWISFILNCYFPLTSPNIMITSNHPHSLNTLIKSHSQNWFAFWPVN